MKNSSFQITVRSADAADFKPVAGLMTVFMAQHHSWHPEHYRLTLHPFTPSIFATWRARPNEVHLVAEIRSEIIGYLYGAVLTSIATTFTFLRHGAQVVALVVSPEVQGRGVGHALCERFEEWARSHKAEYIVLNVSPYNHVAHGLYASYDPFNEYLSKNLKM